MEETVLTTFCVASELRNSAHRPGCPPILKQCAEIVEARLPSSNMANEKFDQSEPVSGKTQGVPVQVSRKRTLLAADIAAKFFGPTSNAEVLDLQSYSFGDRKFSPSRISQAQSIVWAPLGPDHEGAPGIIRQIFDHEGKTHLVIHKYRHRIPSYFDSFPDFGASVWTSDTDSVPQIIETGPLIYSANQRPWAEGEVIIRPLIEVRDCPPVFAVTILPPHHRNGIRISEKRDPLTRCSVLISLWMMKLRCIATNYYIRSRYLLHALKSLAPANRH